MSPVIDGFASWCRIWPSRFEHWLGAYPTGFTKAEGLDSQTMSALHLTHSGLMPIAFTMPAQRVLSARMNASNSATFILTSGIEPNANKR
jgi:hypothetical protein